MKRSVSIKAGITGASSNVSSGTINTRATKTAPKGKPSSAGINDDSMRIDGSGNGVGVGTSVSRYVTAKPNKTQLKGDAEAKTMNDVFTDNHDAVIGNTYTRTVPKKVN